MTPHSTEPKATLGDLLKFIAGLTVIAVILYGPIKKGHQERQFQKAQSTINAKTQDSLLKTIEYQEAMRANQELANKRADIHNYFEQLQKGK